MPIPDFQKIMLPMLKLAGDGHEHTSREAVDFLATEFNLTDDERKQLLPSGRQPVFTNRVAWARAYLKMAQLLENTGRGVFKITALGQDVLKQNPSLINVRFLEQYEHFSMARRGPGLGSEAVGMSGAQPGSNTPEEILEEAYQNIRNALADDILQRVKAAPPPFFEKLVVNLLVAMGYGGTFKEAASTIRTGGADEGLNGVINEDRLGLDVIYVQAKRWQGTVGRPDIQRFAGALAGKHARKGVFITTSDFSKDAEHFVSNIETKIVLINGEQLAQLMIDYGLGTRSTASYEIKEIESDYFMEG